MRESMLIYRSFVEAIKELPKVNQAEVWNAVFEFGLNENEVELNGISKTIFTLIKPQIEANIKRYKNGTKPKTKQKESKTEAKPKQEISKSEANVNDNVNVNENDNVNDNENNTKVLIPELSDFMEYAKKIQPNVLDEEVRKKYYIWVDQGWNILKDNKPRPIKNWKSTLGNTIKYLECKEVDPLVEYMKAHVAKYGAQ